MSLNKEPEQPKPNSSPEMDKFLEEAAAVGVLDKEKDDSLSEKEASDLALKLINEGRFNDLRSAMMGGYSGKPLLQGLSSEVAKEIYKKEPKLAFFCLHLFKNLDADFAAMFLKSSQSKMIYLVKDKIDRFFGKDIFDPKDVVEHLARNIRYFDDSEHNKVAEMLVQSEEGADAVLENIFRFKNLELSVIQKIVISKYSASRVWDYRNSLKNEGEAWDYLRSFFLEGGEEEE